jgi:hypothetical protein
MKETTMLHFNPHDLVFVIPMALVGMLVMGLVPVAARALRVCCRTLGLIVGGALAILVLGALPLLI